MCEQAARYCRDGVHKLLNKEQAKLRAQDSKDQPKPEAQDSESATAAQSGNSGSQPGGIDGLVRWIVTKMSDNKSISTREYAKEEAAVAQEQFFAPEPRKGISVILDIFRRADKDDDGKLSLDEFQAFFSDGSLNEEELEKLFHTIDSDNTSNVDTKELCDYFAKHMGDYEGVLASLETLNLSILKAMDFTKKSLFLIRQEMVVTQKHLGEYCEALKQYLKNVSAQKDCFHVTAVRLPDGLSFVVYEFWDGEEEWKRHLQSGPTKAFQHVKVDTLCQPEAVSTVAVPAAWCSLNRD
ncbi:N-terminal EF-hand calcium-binding protein 2 [Osmerus mordax]|uniref:N-terminal EF-hand calcium-binding protein 2 n=1 Tax=Osmerus mordax TaxID=8014 RepID=UPI00350ED337